MYKVVEVAVSKTNYDFDLLFTYFVPEQFLDNINVGMRVIVPFGKSNSHRQGLVMGIELKNNIDKLKPITTIIDNEPIINSEGISLIKYLKEMTFCTYYNAVKLLLPVGMDIENLKKCTLNSKKLSSYSPNEEELIIIDYFSNNCRSAKEIKYEKVLADLSISSNNQALNSLIKYGIININEELSQKISDKTMKMVKLSSEYSIEDFNSLKLSEGQQRIVDLLLDFETASVKEIMYYANVSISPINTLVKKGYAYFYEKEIYRTPNCISEALEPVKINLNSEQESVYKAIKSDIASQKSNTGLLYGVTGSGKTQIFIKLIRDCLDSGKTAILLVPEISLTAQTTKIFCSEFGKNVALIHSGLSPGERTDEFKRIKNKEARLVIGTRSAVFAPCENIGLIIIDEEQDSSYKSDSNPRFHARAVAKYRCFNNNAYLLLASATPSVESYYMAKSQKYNLYTLNHRFSGNDLPKVIIKDTSDNYNPERIFSDLMISELKHNLDNNDQSIILLNRRGYNTVLKCGSCRSIIKCENCSVPMTYHSANGMLICHQCGNKIKPPSRCMECGSEYISYNGVGTQMAEEKLKAIFPNARILRMDLDTTMSKFSYEKNFSAFLNHEYDIMIGTQMIAKGHNFPDVTLVGVLNADGYLFSDDFRSYEKTFSLLTQVIGRSGRFEKKGRAIIETSMPDCDVIIDASNQDYESFYNSEISVRKNAVYPPFCTLCIVGFTSENEVKAIAAAKYFMDFLISLTKTKEYSKLPFVILGPCASKITKVNNKFRYKITIKCNNNIKTRQMLSKSLIKLFKNNDFKTVNAFIDMYYDGNF